MAESMSKELQSAFKRIYDNDVWRGGSGEGSLPANTVSYRAMVENFIRDNGINTVVDVGCGDWQSSKLMNWNSVKYIGIDVVPAVIKRNQELYATDNIDFDIVTEPDHLPKGDLVLCKEVLQHLPSEMVQQYLEVFGRRYKFSLITNTVTSGEVNSDIDVGGFRPLRLDLAPFNVMGAVILSYLPHFDDPFRVWKNHTLLILGQG